MSEYRPNKFLSIRIDSHFVLIEVVCVIVICNVDLCDNFREHVAEIELLIINKYTFYLVFVYKSDH